VKIFGLLPPRPGAITVSAAAKRDVEEDGGGGDAVQGSAGADDEEFDHPARHRRQDGAAGAAVETRGAGRSGFSGTISSTLSPERAAALIAPCPAPDTAWPASMRSPAICRAC